MTQQASPALFGGQEGPLGRGYMGHLTGSICDLVFADQADVDAFNFVEASGGYIQRRRILPHADTVVEDGIENIALWLDNPARGEASHGSAAASARFLAASAVRMLAGKMGQLPPLGPHFANVGKAPISAAADLVQTAWTLAASRLFHQRHLPRRFLSSGGGGWRVVYHAEQARDPGNRISLSDRQDSIGLPKLRIDFRFGDKDIASVVRAHELLEKDLQRAGVGRLRWTYGDASYETVAATARDGYHQLGGAVMSNDPAEGIVDRNCRTHDLENLFIASGCVFPTGGQANPTLTIIALACRLAEHLASFGREGSGAPLAATSALPAAPEKSITIPVEQTEFKPA
jgi:choline dehydrogenase-like flavoprotein